MEDDTVESKRNYGVISAINPQNYYPYYKTVMIYAHEGDWDKAIQYLEKAQILQTDPDFAIIVQQINNQQINGPLPHPGYPQNFQRGEK